MKIKDIYKNRPLFISLTAAFIVLLTVGIIVFALLSKPTMITSVDGTIPESINLKSMKIIPLLSDSAGVDLKSGFKILCEESYPESKIKSALTITPNQSFRLEKSSEKEFLLSFDGSMNPNQIYKFEIASADSSQKRSWAFQTQKTFKVMRTLPRDKGTSVPVNTGIEITFNYEKADNLDNYFEITPKVKGRFEYHKKTAVFLPEILEPDTVYTVTVKKGLGLKGSDEKTLEDYVFQFQTEALRTPQSEDFISFSDTLYNITSNATPTFEVYASQTLRDKEASVEVYKYPDENKFMENLKKYDALPSWAYVDTQKIEFDTSKLERVLTFKTKIVTGGNGLEWDYPHYIVLPSTLSQGHYIINARISNINQQAHIQVNDASVFISVLKDKTLAWINNSATGDPIAEASIEVSGTQSIKTSNDGIAILPGQLPLPLNGSHIYMKVLTGKNPAFIARVNTYLNYDYRYYNYDGYVEYNNNNMNNSYWTYLYTDRGVYLPTDAINIWGIAKPRDKQEPIKNAKLQLVSGNYSYANSDESSVIQSRDIEVTESGTYEGKLDFSNLSTGYYNINMVYNDTILTSKYFEIRQYTKPAYRLDIQPSKKAIFLGDNINFDITSSFFEGTPVSGLNLEYNCNVGPTTEGKLKCDKNGKANFSATPYLNTNSWWPQGMHVNIRNSQSEEQEVSASSNVMLFPKDTMIEVATKKQGSNALVEIKSSLIDISKASISDDYYNPDKYRGSSVDTHLTATITEEHWERKEIGTYYDSINKKTYKQYDYFTVSNIVKSLDFITSSGKYTFDFAVEKDKTYRILISGFDSKHNQITEEHYYYAGYNYDPYSLQREYQLENSEIKEFYKKGDKVSLNIKSNVENTTPNPKSRCLYLTLQNGFVDYKVLEGNRYSFDFKDTFIPNVYVQAVYFDGTNIFNAGIKGFRYDYKQDLLKINVKPDKTAYKPGDTVKLDVEVKDINNNPCVSDVNLSLVDEAFFAIQDQYVDTLESLYSYNLPAGIVSDYLSYTPLYPNRRNNMAEEGGEGGDEPAIRSKFKDTAFFGSVKTDKNGKASVSFKLPDNLTSWRITYQGINDDMKAGSGKTNISSSLPFFTDIIFNSVFMSGDNPYMTARSFGTKLESGSDVYYEVLLEDDKGNKKNYSAKAPSTDFAGISLGKLDVGNYSITVTAKYSSYKDGIKKDFSVLDNILEASRIKNYKLTEDIKIEGGKTLTKLTFYNNNASFMYNSLSSLMYTWGERVDQKLSRKIAQELMKKYYGEFDLWLAYQDEDFDFGKYQLDDGGIALLSYDSSNPELTAKVCSVAKDSFDRNSLRYYFYNVLDNKDSLPEDIAAAYWGLASLGEPVLLDIMNLLESTGIGMKEKLYLGIALSEIGDNEAAEKIYSKIITSSSKKVEPYIFIDTQSTRDDAIELTALCSVIAMKIHAPEKLGLYNYVKSNSTKDILTNLEILMMVYNSVPDPLPKGKFTFELDGKTKEVTLEQYQTYQITLTREKVEKIKFSNISGDIAVTSNFTGPVKDLMKGSNNMVKLERSYSVNNTSKSEFNRSDLIKITLYPHFEENTPDGFYEITDILPAGLRFVQGDPFDAQKWYPDEVSGQKIVFGYYYGKNNSYFSNKNKVITYYARAVCPGEFTADNAVIKHYDSDAAGFTDKRQLKINN